MLPPIVFICVISQFHLHFMLAVLHVVAIIKIVLVFKQVDWVESNVNNNNS